MVNLPLGVRRRGPGRHGAIVALLCVVSAAYLAAQIMSTDVRTRDAPGRAAAAAPCPRHFAYLRDRPAQAHAMRNASSAAARRRRIPRTVHFLVPSRCVASSVADVHEAAWKDEPKLADHAILYHDQAEVDRYVASGRHGAVFPSAALAYACTKSAGAKLDLARFLLLWEFGGIAVDVAFVPGPAFLRNDPVSNGKHGIVIEDDDACLMEADGDWNAESRFIASAPRHPALFVAIAKLLTASMQLVGAITGPRELLSEGWPNYWARNYTALRRSFYAGFDPAFYHGTNDGAHVRNYRRNKDGFINNTIVQIRAGNISVQGALFEAMNLTQMEERALEFTVQGERQEQCKVVESKLEDRSCRTDIESLIKMAGAGARGEKGPDNTCPEGQTRVSSSFDADSIIPGRRIPKIIHMTSKSKCFTPMYANNIEKWRFPGHSLFLYDDAAVDALFRQFDWPEFPLLRDVLSCIPSGAGKADLWRYLMLWEYGGIYTDIDNGVGLSLLNGTVIEDHMDSFFEQERGGFPSQYFMAGEFARSEKMRLFSVLWTSNQPTSSVFNFCRLLPQLLLVIR